MPAARVLSSRANAPRATRSAPTRRWSSSTARSNEGAVSSGGKAATIHAWRKCSRKRRSSTARADAMVAARANCCGRSGPSVATAETSSTPASVPRAIVLAAMDEQGALFGDAGADAVGAFDLLGPDAAEPDAPAFEIVGAGFIAAMVNRDSRVVAQEDDVALLADDGVKTIDFFSCVNDDVGDGFFRGF